MTRDLPGADAPNDDTGTGASPAAARRRFLTASTCLATSLAVPDVAGASAMPSSGLRASDFRRALNTAFRATALSHSSPDVIPLTLTDVRASPHAHPSLDKARASELVFSLKFEAGRNGLLQDTYLLSHPDLGDFAALLVPTAGGNSLCAEFHRL